jgi:hypothetical protein
MTRNDEDGPDEAEAGGGGSPVEPDDRIEELLASRQEFLQVFKRGAEFTEALMRENQRLRYRVAELETRHGPTHNDDDLVRELMDKLTRVEHEKRELVARISGVERENHDFASRYVEIEQENNNLLNIYVASYQLHSTLDYDEVLRAITEVVLNFIGAEVFTVGTIDAPGHADGLSILVAEGVGLDEANEMPQSAIVKDAIENGMPHFVSGELEDVPVDFSVPAVCVPLKIKDQTIGVLSIYKFLQQKKRLASVDHELFTLLAGHAATALFAAKLYTDSRRKLSTIQGFIDLVTSSTT